MVFNPHILCLSRLTLHTVIYYSLQRCRLPVRQQWASMPVGLEQHVDDNDQHSRMCQVAQRGRAAALGLGHVPVSAVRAAKHHCHVPRLRIPHSDGLVFLHQVSTLHPKG